MSNKASKTGLESQKAFRTRHATPLIFNGNKNAINRVLLKLHFCAFTEFLCPEIGTERTGNGLIITSDPRISQRLEPSSRKASQARGEDQSRESQWRIGGGVKHLSACYGPSRQLPQQQAHRARGILTKRVAGGFSQETSIGPGTEGVRPIEVLG